LTLTRIHHLFRTPYYVYRYATSYAASAQLYDQVTKEPKKQRKAALERYLNLLKSGGNDYADEAIKKGRGGFNPAGTIMAVINRMDELVTLWKRRSTSFNR